MTNFAAIQPLKAADNWTKDDLITRLFSHLSQFDYIVLKEIEDTRFKKNDYSDIDLLVKDKNTVQAVYKWLLIQREVDTCTILSLTHVTHLYIYQRNGGFLQLDFLTHLERKAWVYLENNDLWSAKYLSKYSNRYVLPEYMVLEHAFLFNLLNNAGLSKTYMQYLEVYDTHEKTFFLDYLNTKYNLDLTTIADIEKFSFHHHSKVMEYLEKLPSNTFLQLLKRKMSYIKDIMTRATQNKGLVITFSGVDGAGKTTILNEITGILKNKYRMNVVLLRHRPSLLPIISSFKYGKKNAEQRAAERLPRQGGNTNTLGGYLRFFYYFIDYLIGQWYVFFKYTLQGTTVLYDRYYFDFIADPKRSNIGISSPLFRSLYGFLLQPDHNFFLYAPAEIILNRKKELDEQSINELTNAYRNLFADLDNNNDTKTYLSIENIDLNTTVQKILTTIFK